MITQLELLASIIESALADANTVEEVPVYVTAGRPAAPSTVGVDCQTRVYVFPVNVTDFNQNNPDACEVKTRLAMGYEIWTCYPEEWEDQVTTDEGLAAADRLVELMQLVWCALVDAKDDETFGETCWTELEPMNVTDRLGGAVSALGGVSVSYDCPLPTSP